MKRMSRTCREHWSLLDEDDDVTDVWSETGTDDFQIYDLMYNN